MRPTPHPGWAVRLPILILRIALVSISLIEIIRPIMIVAYAEMAAYLAQLPQPLGGSGAVAGRKLSENTFLLGCLWLVRKGSHDRLSIVSLCSNRGHPWHTLVFA